MAADGVANQEIAIRLSISRPTVQFWQEGFPALRVAGLEKDALGPGRIPSIPKSKVCPIVEATLHAKSPAATHLSSRQCHARRSARSSSSTK